MVCNPRKNALLKHGNKSDKIGAGKLADLSRLNDLELKGRRLGRPRVIVDVSKIASLRSQGLQIVGHYGSRASGRFTVTPNMPGNF